MSTRPRARLTVLMLVLGVAATGCLHRQWRRAVRGGEPIEVEAGRGPGNLRLGMSPGAIQRRLGHPEDETSFESGETYWIYYRLGLSVRLREQRADTFFFYSGAKGGWETRPYAPFPGVFVAGISMKTRPHEILARLGPPQDQGEIQGAPIPASWFSYDTGLGFCYRTADDRLIYAWVCGDAADGS